MFQPDHGHHELRDSGVPRRHLRTRLSHPGSELLAGNLLPHDHILVLLASPGDPADPLHCHRPSPHGRPADLLHQRRLQQACSPASRHDAGDRRLVLLPLSASIPHPHRLDRHPPRLHSDPRNGRLLQLPLLLPHHAVHELRRQSDPVQLDVLEVPSRFPKSLRMPKTQQERLAPPARHDSHHHPLTLFHTHPPLPSVSRPFLEVFLHRLQKRYMQRERFLQEKRDPQVLPDEKGLGPSSET